MGFKPKVAALSEVRLDFAEADEDSGIREAIIDLKQKAIANTQTPQKSSQISQMSGKKRTSQAVRSSDLNPELRVNMEQRQALKRRKLEQK